MARRSTMERVVEVVVQVRDAAPPAEFDILPTVVGADAYQGNPIIGNANQSSAGAGYHALLAAENDAVDADTAWSHSISFWEGAGELCPTCSLVRWRMICQFGRTWYDGGSKQKCALIIKVRSNTMNGQPQTQPNQQQINIKIDDVTMKGAYSNAMGVSHSKEEFVLDFMNIYAHQRSGIVSARVITSPGHMKRIYKALEENIKKYEDRFGKIEEAAAPGAGDIGFRTV